MTNLRIWGNVKVTYSRHRMLLHTAWSLLGQVPMHPHYTPPSKPTSLWSRYMMTWWTLWKRMLVMVIQQRGYSVPLSTRRLWWKWSRPTSVHIHSYLDTHTPALQAYKNELLNKCICMSTMSSMTCESCGQTCGRNGIIWAGGSCWLATPRYTDPWNDNDNKKPVSTYQHQI